MKKIISLQKVSKKKYKELPFTGVFADSFGLPEQGSKWLILGQPKNGKTEFCMQLLKYIKQFGKAAYYSKEQGDSLSMQKAIIRNGLGDTPLKEVHFGFDGNFEDLQKYLKKQRGVKTLFIDSVDYLNLTKKQIEFLCGKKKLTIIFIAWSSGNQPKSLTAKSLIYMVDVVVPVNRFVAEPSSRYGGFAPYVIWEAEAKKHHAFLNRENNTK
jgi:hypothetical protein